jgi:hypothetical protein
VKADKTDAAQTKVTKATKVDRSQQKRRLNERQSAALESLGGSIGGLFRE